MGEGKSIGWEKGENYRGSGTAGKRTSNTHQESKFAKGQLIVGGNWKN